MSNYYIPQSRRDLLFWLSNFYPLKNIRRMPKKQLWAVFFKKRKLLTKQIESV